MAFESKECAKRTNLRGPDLRSVWRCVECGLPAIEPIHFSIGGLDHELLML